MITKLTRREPQLAVCLLILSLVLVACRKVTNVRQEEVEERINRDAPLGSGSSQVIAFLNSLDINGVRVEHTGYIPGNLIGTDELKNSRHEVKGHIMGWMKNTARDPSKFQVYRIEMIFYFDEGDHLINHKIGTWGDW